MIDMSKRLRDIQDTVKSQKDDSLVQQQMQIANIKYTETHNIALAYSKFFDSDIKIQGILKDVQMLDKSICLFVSCVVYGFTDATIMCRMDLTDKNIDIVKELVGGKLLTVSGKVNMGNNSLYLDNQIIL